MVCSELNNISKKNKSKVFFHELAHHLPYGTLSVACALMLLSLISVFLKPEIVSEVAHSHSHTGGCSHNSDLDILFHSFHFTHILFAVSGSMMTFYRYSKNVIAGVIVGVISSSVFCTLSDVLLPYLAGIMFGVSMDLHICFFSELPNILPFLFVGALNGLVMLYIKEFQSERYSLQLHFLHTLISAMASIFYAIGHGFSDFYAYFGIFFLLILVAVVIPCTLADVVVPIICARMVDKK